MNGQIKVLISDKSAIMRVLLEQHLKSDINLTFLESQASGRATLSLATQKKPDLVIIDPDCSDIDGFQLINILIKEQHISVFVLSTNPSYKEKCILSGVKGFMIKPSLKDVTVQFYNKLLAQINSIDFNKSNTSNNIQKEQVKRNFKILCVGASTGGPGTLQRVFNDLGPNFDLPIAFVQHIDTGTDHSMIKWFKDISPKLTVVLAKEGMEPKKGIIYMAPANKHLEIIKHETKGIPVFHLNNDPEDHFLRPSVNYLFKSCAKTYGPDCLALLLTGMGKDGAEGCKEIQLNGGYTIAESQDSCIVYGMPKAAIDMNAANEVLHKNDVAKRIKQLIIENH